MNILRLLNDERFNIVFSFAVGLGLICLMRPICKGSECDVTKAPNDTDFDKYVYRLTGGKCYEFKTNIVSCPASGTIEAFRECALSQNKKEPFRDQFLRRDTPIKQCE
jgi:hypothetical protein